MPRSLALAVAAVLLMPAAAQAGTHYLVDVTVRKSVIVERECADGSRHATEKGKLWSASGSGELPGDAGIIQLLEERLTASSDFPADGDPVKERDIDLLRERDRDFDDVVSLKAGRVVLDLGRFSPVKRKIKVKPGGRKVITKTIKENVEEGKPDAAGCTPTTIRVTDVFGSLERFGS